MSSRSPRRSSERPLRTRWSTETTAPRYDGQAVSVDIFDDRLEILNPGGLYGTKTRENLADGASCCRNATLMKLMSLVPLPAGAGLPAEGNGSGVPMMIRECEQRGIRAPEFRPALDSFKVVLARPTYEGGRLEAARLRRKRPRLRLWSG
ncbi:ATP-binding protein [Paratractidigestivibacter sp.]|uniref:ATP-binding protein n=1 Tax=Paratractidigestivibacter sp. TaxID=2847316 RepID=UPI002ACB0B06|nr:ATP-binding protein [Paratractidigestivibacter sp.]